MRICSGRESGLTLKYCTFFYLVVNKTNEDSVEIPLIPAEVEFVLFHWGIMNRIVIVIVSVCFLMVCGCRFPWRVVPVGDDPGPPHSEIKRYKQGVEAYRKGAYGQAFTLFKSVRDKTEDKRLANMALFGSACSNLMAAETPENYYDALLLWQQWVESAPNKFEYENPLLFDAMIKEKMLFSNIPLTATQSEMVGQEPMVSRWLLIKSKEELDRLKVELNNTLKSLEKHKKMVKANKREISKLKRQIKALETIDQKIQKKKDAIPSADTSAPR